MVTAEEVKQRAEEIDTKVNTLINPKTPKPQNPKTPSFLERLIENIIYIEKIC